MQNYDCMNYLEGLAHFKNLSKIKGLNSFDIRIKIRQIIENLTIAIKPAVAEERELREITKDFDIEFEQLYIQLSGNKTKKEESNGVEIESWDIPDDKIAELNDKIKFLNEKYADKIKEFQSRSVDFQLFIRNKEMDFTPVLIPMSLIKEKDSNISDEYLEYLSPFIDYTK